MAVLFLLLFIGLPLLELYVIVNVATAVGIVPTLALLVLISVLGSWLVSRQGLGVVRRARSMLDAGELPTAEVLDGVLLVLAGALLLAPGFVTDVFGLILLIPVTRALTRRLATGRFARRMGVLGGFAGAASSAGSRAWSAASRSRGSTGRQYVGEAIIVEERTERAGLPTARRGGNGIGSEGTAR